MFCFIFIVVHNVLLTLFKELTWIAFPENSQSPTGEIILYIAWYSGECICNIRRELPDKRHGSNQGGITYVITIWSFLIVWPKRVLRVVTTVSLFLSEVFLPEKRWHNISNIVVAGLPSGNFYAFVIITRHQSAEHEPVLDRSNQAAREEPDVLGASHHGSPGSDQQTVSIPRVSRCSLTTIKGRSQLPRWALRNVGWKDIANAVRRCLCSWKSSWGCFTISLDVPTVTLMQ